MLNKLRQFLKAQNLIAPGSTVTCALSGGAGKGPFHRGYTLRVWGIDPQAETIYLSYGPGDPVFTFTLDLEEGAA